MSLIARRLAVTVAIALSVAACSSPAATSAPTAAPAAACSNSTEAGQVAVAIKDFKFDPEPVAAKVGQVIVWTNQDSTPHTATIDGTSCDTGMLSAGKAAGIVFSTPGTYTYVCKVHPVQMKGSVVVSG